MTKKIRNAPPKASAMLEALRGLGYSTADALADIVDNSISAGASEVRIDFRWEGGDRAFASILDNGRGMNDPELEAAMRLGEKSPLDERSGDDLGRFGMGLKTASFSQCRSLTVASKRDGSSENCLRWDLDEIAARDDGAWALIEGAAEDSQERLAPLEGLQSGTLVLWEKLDRIVTEGYNADHFLKLMDRVEMRLAMIFHRLLEGFRPVLRLLINGRAVEPWDPFLTGHPAKPWNSPVERKWTPAGMVEVECHVLPHKDMLTTACLRSGGGTGRLELSAGFLCLPQRQTTAGRGMAWPRARKGLEPRGGAETCANQAGYSEYCRRGLENRHQEGDSQNPSLSPSMADDACRGHAP